MEKDTLNNVHICSEQVLMTPSELKVKLPISNHALGYIQTARETIANIIAGKDKRLLVVCGPC